MEAYLQRKVTIIRDAYCFQLWIFEQEFARNEYWLRILEWKFALFDKWLFSKIALLYLLCSNILTHFLDDDLPSSNLPGFFFYVTSHSFVSFTTNLCPFIPQGYTRLTCVTSKVPFTVKFTFKASQLLHHRKSPSSWLFIITQPDTNHSLGRLANFAQVLPGLKLCSSFAHLTLLQETPKPTFT